MIVGDPCERAQEFLMMTELFDDLGIDRDIGIGRLASLARCVARDVLELAEELDAERSARVAMQENRDAIAAAGRGPS